MMISPDGRAAFIEIPKTGSTACTVHLQRHKWFQNGSKGTKRVPGTQMGRHTKLTDEAASFLMLHGTTTYCVVRNPFDRAASMWRASNPKRSWSLYEYFTKGSFKHGKYDLLQEPQIEWASNCNHVLHYETLERDWNDCLDLPVGPIKPVNVSKNRAEPEWTDRELELVADRFAADINRWGYDGPGDYARNRG